MLPVADHIEAEYDQWDCCPVWATADCTDCGRIVCQSELFGTDWGPGSEDPEWKHQ